MSAQTDSLVQAAACDSSCIPQGLQWAVVISLLAKIAGVSTDTNSLMANAVCINSCIPQGLQLAVMISLLSQITGGGVTAGAAIVTQNPNGVTTPSFKGQQVFNTNNDTLWINTDGTINGWVQLI